MTSYRDFISTKTQSKSGGGFSPTWFPKQAFDFQRSLITYSVETGRSAVFADCGLGKTLIQLAWAENVHRHTNKPVLIFDTVSRLTTNRYRSREVRNRSQKDSGWKGA